MNPSETQPSRTFKRKLTITLEGDNLAVLEEKLQQIEAFISTLGGGHNG